MNFFQKIIEDEVKKQVSEFIKTDMNAVIESMRGAGDAPEVEQETGGAGDAPEVEKETGGAGDAPIVVEDVKDVGAYIREEIKKAMIGVANNKPIETDTKTLDEQYMSVFGYTEQEREG